MASRDDCAEATAARAERMDSTKAAEKLPLLCGRMGSAFFCHGLRFTVYVKLVSPLAGAPEKGRNRLKNRSAATDVCVRQTIGMDLPMPALVRKDVNAGSA